MNEKSSQQHWSKDFVEHLRSIHFALLALSLGLLVIGTGSPKALVANADDQVRQIADLCLRIPANWLDDFAKEHAVTSAPMQLTSKLAGPDSQLSSAAEILDIQIGQQIIPVRAEFPKQLWFISAYAQHRPQQLNMSTDFAGTTYTIANSPALYTVPSTLDQFRQLWDDLAAVSISSAESLENYGSAYKEVGAAAGGIPQSSVERNSLVFRGVDLGSTPGKDWDFVKLTHHSGTPSLDVQGCTFFLAKWAWATTPYSWECAIAIDGVLVALIVPVHYSISTVNARGELIKRGGAKWNDGNFNTSFWELSDVTGTYMDANFELAKRILAAERNRSDETFEAFGIKLPAERTRWWGVGMLLSVELYLFIHIFEFRKRLSLGDPGWAVPWIGMYRSKLARAVFWCSFLLPVCSTVLIWWQTLRFTSSRFAAIVGMIVSSATVLFLGLFSLMSIPKN